MKLEKQKKKESGLRGLVVRFLLRHCLQIWVCVFVWFNEPSWLGWLILLLIVWNKLGFFLSFWVSGFLSVWDFWVFFDFMILAMNLYGRMRKTDGFSAWVFQHWFLFSSQILLHYWFDFKWERKLIQWV